ncbi:hypothetical protein EC988_002188 [Linderina pennispora]|nr:hypothetical protein EC988_002188 [Linderina pennispora]
MDNALLVNLQGFKRNLNSAKLDKRSMVGFLRQAADGVIWPQGALYAHKSGTLQGLCRSQKARDEHRGKYKDVKFGHAVATLSGGSMYNVDKVANIHHIQHQPSRFFTQYLQYCKCK